MTFWKAHSCSGVPVGLAAFSAVLATSLALSACEEADSNAAALREEGPAALALAADPDADGDGLSDRVETNTRIYRSPTDTGTNPRVADTDEDGLSDGEEVLGRPNVNLAAMGVSPLRRDVLIEYDWFDDAQECGQHSHKPTQGMMARVKAAFAAAPIQNPDGSRGVNLIQDYGQGGPFTGGSRIAGDPVIQGNSLGATFQSLMSAHMAHERVGAFHWALMAHRYVSNGQRSSSGNGELPGDAFMVTLHCSYDREQIVANTIMHEIGHNFGLTHSGSQARKGGPELNCKPNYNSVMNYLYQFAGIDNDGRMGGDGTLDYSRGQLAPLDEQRMSNSIGIRPGIPWDWCAPFLNTCNVDLIGQNTPKTGCSGQTFASDVNNDGQIGILEDSDDWRQILAPKDLVRIDNSPEALVCPPPPTR